MLLAKMDWIYSSDSGNLESKTIYTKQWLSDSGWTGSIGERSLRERSTKAVAQWLLQLAVQWEYPGLSTGTENPDKDCDSLREGRVWREIKGLKFTDKTNEERAAERELRHLQRFPLEHHCVLVCVCIWRKGKTCQNEACGTIPGAHTGLASVERLPHHGTR